MGCESRHKDSPRVYRRSGIPGSTMVFKEYTGVCVFKVPLGSEVAHLYLSDSDKVSLSSSGGAALPEISVLHT